MVAGVVAVVLGVTLGGIPAVASQVADLGEDRAWAASLVRSGTPSVARAAEAALLGSDADLQAFVETGYDAAVVEDYRATAQVLGSTDGPWLTLAAKKALGGTEDELRQFVDGGYRSAWTTDERLRVARAMEAGGPKVREAGQAALAGTPAQVSKFLESGLDKARAFDDRLTASTMLTGGSNNSGPVLDAAAQAALAGSPEELREFLATGQFVARARDAELASVQALTEQAREAGERTAAETALAVESSGRAASAAERAKASAQEALAETQAAGGAAAAASAAAGRAEDAASAAESAASEAVSASGAAMRAAQTAADAARKATAAASLTAQAAAAAQSAAAAARADRSKVDLATRAAEAAYAAFEQAKVLAQARLNRDIVLTQAREAAAAARSASVNADAAAAAADTASRQAGVSQSQARKTREAAAAAKAQAARASDAAQRSLEFAEAAAAASDEAFDFAERAAQHAWNAARAAEEAVQHAGDASQAAATSAEHARAATEASKLAEEAAEQAAEIEQLAREADEIRLEQATALGIAEAQEAQAAAEVVQAAGGELAALDRSVRWDAEEEQRVADSTRALLDEASARNAPRDVVLASGRRAALELMRTGGEWTRAAAVEALGADEATLRWWLAEGREIAVGQDNRARVWHLVDTLPEGNQRKAARAALDGDDAAVATFLRTRSYSGKVRDQRLEIARILDADPGPYVSAAAQKALDGTSAQADEFLRNGYYTARVADQRIAVARVMETGGPEVRAAAQIALAGPESYVSAFLATGQYEAAQRDVEQETHVLAVRSLVQQAKEYAQKALADAAEARRVAAVAASDAEAAKKAASDAQAAAAQAATYAGQAAASAAAAKDAAERAAASARAAKEAARQAQESAQSAARSVVVASAAAKQAKADAARAQIYKEEARADAVEAGKDAAAVRATAVAAHTAYLTRLRQENIQWRSAVPGSGPDGTGTAFDFHELTKCLALSRPGAPNVSACRETWIVATETIVSLGKCHPWAIEHSVRCQALDSLVRDLAAAAEQNPDLFWSVVLDTGQLALGICGFFSGPAEACDGVDIVISMLRGDFKGAALSAGAVIPGLGLFPGAAKTGRNYTRFTRTYENLAAFRKGLSVGAKACSFAGDTPVLMADGTHKPIAQIVVGDEVIATDPVLGEQGSRPVEQVFVHDDMLSRLEFRDGTSLETTEDHPFWTVTEQQFVRADDLSAGDQVLSASGALVSVDRFVGDGALLAPAYNLAIDDIHTYHVGENDILVHNLCLKLRPDGRMESPGGLIYGPDPNPNFPSRVEHVQYHQHDDPNRMNASGTSYISHGVFADDALETTDEAWAIAQSGKAVTFTSGVRTRYYVNMNRDVGFVGGRPGAGAGNPLVRYVLLIVENGNEVVSSYPVSGVPLTP